MIPWHRYYATVCFNALRRYLLDSVPSIATGRRGITSVARFAGTRLESRGAQKHHSPRNTLLIIIEEHLEAAKR